MTDKTINLLKKSLGEIQQRHYKEISNFVGQRFLAGVAHELEKCHSVPGVWVELHAKSSVDWVRSTQERSDRRPGPAPEHKAFVNSLGQHRKAISSNDAQVRQILVQQLQPWANTRYIDRDVFILVAKHMCAKPNDSLTEELLATLQARDIAQALDEPTGPSRPRRL